MTAMTAMIGMKPNCSRLVVSRGTLQRTAKSLRWLWVSFVSRCRLDGQHPANVWIPDEILVFDLASRSWILVKGGWPEPVVSGITVRGGDEWFVISGEIMTGVRTPTVWASRPIGL